MIVPVLHEAGRIVPLVAQLRTQARTEGVGLEIVVVDGDPRGSTLAALHAAGTGEAGPGPDLVMLRAGPGRAAQLNAGARAASGEVLLFLHADTRLPGGALIRARQVLGNGLAQVGAFDLQFDARGPSYALIAALARLRSRLERCPYGDQAHFFPRAIFFGLGGYPEIPLMEDVELMRTARRRGLVLCILPDRVTTSARRYAAEGPLRRALRNVGLRLAHAAGADPARLARRYARRSDRGADAGRSAGPGPDGGAS